MKLLVLGGTGWLGRAAAAEAVRRGHHVACLARGSSGGAPDGARLVVADRDRTHALDAVRGKTWDAVLDIATQPGQVRRAVAALEPAAARYLFVSTGNVYADQRTPGQDEDAPLLPPVDADVMPGPEQYGEAKVACEQAVLGAFGAERSLIARAGLMGGPGDGSGRSGYWPWRFAHPADPSGVLVPDALGAPVAVIDVRDLADWLVDAAEAGTSGVFNAGGEPLPLGEHLAVAARVAGFTGALVPAPEAWLREHAVEIWMGPRSLPLWIDDPDWQGMNRRDTARARAAGLTTRPLEQTYADVLAWEEARPHPGPHGAGLTDEEERALLAELHGSGSIRDTP